MSTGGNHLRGDVVLLDVAFVTGQGSKVRPAVVIQTDQLNARLQSTMLAVITTNTSRAATEPTQLLIDITNSEGQATGLLAASTVKCEHLITANQSRVKRKIGRFSPALLARLEICLKAALDLS